MRPALAKLVLQDHNWHNALGLHPLMDELLFMLSLSNNHNPFSVVRFIGHAFSPEASNKYYTLFLVTHLYYIFLLLENS